MADDIPEIDCKVFVHPNGRVDISIQMPDHDAALELVEALPEIISNKIGEVMGAPSVHAPDRNDGSMCGCPSCEAARKQGINTPMQ